MSTKRIILADGSRLLREMLNRVIHRADNLEVIQEVPNYEELPSVIDQFEPEWVIVPLPFNDGVVEWSEGCLATHPFVRFIFLSPDDGRIKMKWQESREEDLGNISLNDLIEILEADLQET
jgi:DNA-binding NarL/FixJ family response regulator